MTDATPVLDPSIQAVLDFAQPIHMAMQLNPCDLFPGGKYPLPQGFDVTIDTFHERVRVFGPYSDQGILVKTLVPYGGEFKITGEELLRVLTQVCDLGEPHGKRSLEERRQYFLNLLASAKPFTVPEPKPMNRAELEQHVEICEVCRPVNAAFIQAINSGANIATEPHVRTMVEKAHANADEAVKHYQQIRDAHQGAFTRPLAAPARRPRKPASQPVVA